MKKVILSAVAIITMGFVAWGSEDITSQPVVLDKWTGPYIGVQLGGIWGTGDVSIPAYPSNFTFKPGDITSGIYEGYNWLFGNSVQFGVEAELNSISTDESSLSGGGYGETYNFTQYWDMSLRANVGAVIANRYLPYLTGGIAWTRLGTSYDPRVAGESKTTVAGFTVGAGLEVKLTEHLNARFLYRYTDYSKADFVHYGLSSVDYKSQMLEEGISYRF